VFDIGFGELLLLAVLALFVFGPERLPKVAADAARMLREVRTMASNARRQLTDTIDPELREIDIQGLNPREFVRRALDEPVEEPQVQRRADSPPPAEPGTARWDADTT
jgi:sec-independent protein translocase protein TatB